MRLEKVEPSDIREVELGMEALADLASAEAIREKVGGLVNRYRDWIGTQAGAAATAGRRGEVANALFNQARAVANRMEQGLAALKDPQVS